MACRCRKAYTYRKKITTKSGLEKIYLDHAASTIPERSVLKIFQDTVVQSLGNSASIHICGIQLSLLIEETRQLIANYFNVTPNHVLFTPGGTQGMRALVQSIGLKSPTFITTSIEHSSIFHAIEKKSHIIINVLPNGEPNFEELTNALKQPSPIFIYSPVHHETGATRDSKKIYDFVHTRGGHVIIDGVQALSRMPFASWATFADAITISSHKFYGLAGIGGLIMRGSLPLRSRKNISLEQSIYGATPNAPFIHAMGHAFKILMENLANDLMLMQGLENDLMHYLARNEIDVIRNTPSQSSTGIINISFPKIKNFGAFFTELLNKQICVSRFSACTGSINGYSEHLLAMGVPKRLARRSIRVSFGRQSKREDIFNFIHVLKELSTRF